MTITSAILMVHASKKKPKNENAENKIVVDIPTFTVNTPRHVMATVAFRLQVNSKSTAKDEMKNDDQGKVFP